MRTTQIRISPHALAHNLALVKRLAPQAKVMSMLKANAYGHGAAPCLNALQDSDLFGVACLEEAQSLRELGAKQPIVLIEGLFSASELELALALDCECVLHHQEQLTWLMAGIDAYRARGLKAWVKLNSGMNRLGFSEAECIHAIQSLTKQGLDCVLLSHFANADNPGHPLNAQQIAALTRVKNACPSVQVSCCNSAAIFNWPELHFDYVRPGIMLYGASPFATQSAKALGLLPAMQFVAQVIALHQIQAGDCVGYGSTFTATQAMTIAIVSAGYGDGYPRHFATTPVVSIQQQPCRLLGRVSMDMLCVDVSHLSHVTLTEEVELWGKHVSVDQVALANQTIGYELLCRLSTRPQRVLEG